MSKQSDLLNLTDAISVSGTNVGIGTSSPSSYTANGNNLVIEDTNVGMTLASNTTTGTGAIYFADGTAGSASYRGIINYLHASDSMGFFTASTQRMVIDSSGNVLVGLTSSADIAGTTNNGWMLKNNQIQHTSSGTTMYLTASNAGTQGFVTFYSQSTVVGAITTSGSSTSYATSSDYRLKTDAQPMTGASDRVLALKPVNFEWISSGERVDGFLAHEAQEIVPEAVTGTKDAMRDEQYEVTAAVLDADGMVVTEAVMGTRSVPDYQGIDQSKLVPLLTAALQEALTEISALKVRVAALEAN